MTHRTLTRFQVKLDSPVKSHVAVSSEGIVTIEVDELVTTQEFIELIQACDARSRRCVGLMTKDNTIMPPSVACRSLSSNTACFRPLFAAERETPEV